jgi:hypothetical protein
VWLWLLLYGATHHEESGWELDLSGSKETLELAGLWTIEEYIGRRKTTVMEYANERPVYRRCLASKALASRPNQLVWWTNGTSTDGETSEGDIERMSLSHMDGER